MIVSLVPGARRGNHVSTWRKRGWPAASWHLVSRSVAFEEETERERATRRRQRTEFDQIAALYEATRPGYPRELVEFIAQTAGLSPGSPVLEIGCGTGQLTEHLAGIGLQVTAIDLG